MINDLVIYGGSFNPPGVHHERIAEALDHKFQSGAIVPCGNGRPGKTAPAASPAHRRELCIRAFQKRTISLDDQDLITNAFTPLVDMQARYASQARQVWHVIGSDLIQGGEDGNSEIQRLWKNGRIAWNQIHFVIVERPGYPVRGPDLPARHRILRGVHVDGSSSKIRERIRTRGQWHHLVSRDVRAYIEEHRLYHPL